MPEINKIDMINNELLKAAKDSVFEKNGLYQSICDRRTPLCRRADSDG